jgi:hypothetical protein
MGRISEVQHQGKTILFQDFSRLHPGKEFRDAVVEGKRYMASQPRKSVLSLVDATEAVYTSETLAALKDYSKHNEPFVKAAAVLGIKGLLSVALMAISRFSGRTFKTFDDRAAALDWLVAQP